MAMANATEQAKVKSRAQAEAKLNNSNPAKEMKPGLLQSDFESQSSHAGLKLTPSPQGRRRVKTRRD